MAEEQPDSRSTLPSIFESYICRDPVADLTLLTNNGPDQYTALLRTLQRSAEHFAEKDQTRTVERLQFEIARLHMQQGQWQRAMRTLLPLWQTLTWRQGGWWDLLEELDWALKECALKLSDLETLAAVEWELLNRSLTTRQDSCTNFGRALDGLELQGKRPKTVVNGENVISCLSATFAFASPEGNVGEPLASQLVLQSHIHKGSRPITVNSVRISFDRGLRNITISQKGGDTQKETRDGPTVTQQEVHLNSRSDASTPTGADEGLFGHADLMTWPGHSIVISLINNPREAGDVVVSEIVVSVKEEDFDLDLVLREDQLQQDHFWGFGPEEPRKILTRSRSHAVNILPKPPKMQIGLLRMQSSYFVEETVVLDLNLANQEEEGADGSLQVRVSGPAGAPPVVSWVAENVNGHPLEEESSASYIEGGFLKIPPKPLGLMSAGSEVQRQLQISSVHQPTEYTLHIESRYSLSSDPETIITKTYTTEIVFIQPFDVSCAFTPQVHPDSWPNYFDTDDLDDTSDEQATGLIQRWTLSSRLHNLTTDDLVIDSIIPIVHHVQDAVVKEATSASTGLAVTVAADSAYEATNILDVQKPHLEDRRQTQLDLDLRIIFYRRTPASPDEKSKEITAQLPLPPLQLNFSEPRVLASLSPENHVTSNEISSPSSLPIHLLYTLENPSAYALPFTAMMDTPDTSRSTAQTPSSATPAVSAPFAFAGPKSMSFIMPPLTRREISYTILPFPSAPSTSTSNQTDRDRDSSETDTVLYPVLRVTDTAFGKRLRVWPTLPSSPPSSDAGVEATAKKETVVMRGDYRRDHGAAGAQVAGTSGTAGASVAGGGVGGIALWVSTS